MKKLGIIGGLSWHSSLEYYKTLNEMIEGQAEGQGAKIILNSLDFSSSPLYSNTLYYTLHLNLHCIFLCCFVRILIVY